MLSRIVQFISVIAVANFVLATACSSAPSGAPDTERIKGDLIGHTIGAWRFDSLSEYEKFEIKETTSSGNVVEYKTIVVLKDRNNGKRYSADLWIQYRKEGEEWKLINVTDNRSLKEISLHVSPGDSRLAKRAGEI